MKESQPVDTFGFLKSQLSNDSAGRVGTPTLPPGLPVPQAHSSTSAFQEHLSSSKPSSPAPMVPPGLGANISRGGTPSQKNLVSETRSMTPEMHTRTTSTSTRVKDASQISLGSPVARSATKARQVTKDELRLATDEKDLVAQPDKGSVADTKGSPASLAMPLAAQETSSVKSERALSGTFASAPGSASAVGSRPNTPLTAASRVSDSSRQPRILRVVETHKPGAPLPASNAAPMTSTATVDKSRSRRQSLSSNSRPDTPGDFGSEADLFPSSSASRTNSPPASTRIGSAPVRSITKSQAKKERRQKAREAEAKKAESAPVVEEVQAPIIGRKRKTKKAPAASTEPADTITPSVTETASPVKAPAESPKKPDPKPEPAKKEKEQPVPEAKPARVEEQPEKSRSPAEEAWRAHNTVVQLVKDAEKSGRSIKDLLMERTKPIHELLAGMQKFTGLEFDKSSLFNPVNLSQRTDMKCSAEDHDILNQSIELAEEHRKALLRGEPVRTGGDQLKSRFMITPRGSVIRHFEPEEEELYLALEKKHSGFTDPIVVGDDFSNINGGLEALFATPEKYDICWMDDTTEMGTTSGPETVESIIPPNVLSAMEADSARSHDWAVAHSAELLQTTTAAVRSFAAATAKQMLGSAGVTGSNPSLDDIAAMTNDEMKGIAGRSQKDLESTRKELDSLDKKFAALLRRNKKLQQQALSSATDED